MKIITRAGLAEYKEQLKKEAKEYEEKYHRVKNFSIMNSFYNNIPSIYSGAWLEDCDKRITEWLEKKNYFWDVIWEKNPDAEPTTKPGLYIYGPAGTGKTHTLYALYRNQCLNNEYAKIINTVELLRLFKKDFKTEEDNFEMYLKDEETTLYLDDLGAERNTEFVEETLYHLINVRFENQRETYFTSNLSLKELAEKSGDRLASRIAGMCDVIKLEGEDRRLRNV